MIDLLSLRLKVAVIPSFWGGVSNEGLNPTFVLCISENGRDIKAKPNLILFCPLMLFHPSYPLLPKLTVSLEKSLR